MQIPGPPGDHIPVVITQTEDNNPFEHLICAIAITDPDW